MMGSTALLWCKLTLSRWDNTSIILLWLKSDDFPRQRERSRREWVKGILWNSGTWKSGYDEYFRSPYLPPEVKVLKTIQVSLKDFYFFSHWFIFFQISEATWVWRCGTNSTVLLIQLLYIMLYSLSKAALTRHWRQIVNWHWT